MPFPPDPVPPIAPADLDILPVERAETIPARWYHDPAFAPLERDSVFARTWQHVGHASQLPNPGDHLTATIAGKPVIVVRAGNGRLHAFFNVCRHRGGPIALKDGHANMLQCRYHGWTYRLDGMLRGVPHFNRTELFDKKDFGLLPLRLTEWQGLLFVHLDDTPTPLETFVEGVAERLGSLRLDTLRFAGRKDYEARCNWKVYVDNYLEGYHVPHVHPELCALYDFQAYRTEIAEWYSLQVGPLAGKDTPYGVSQGEALYYFLFPNLMLNILPGRLQTNVVVPLAPDRCRIEFRYYYAETDSEAARTIVTEDARFSDAVQDEDIEICERVQEGLASGLYDRGRFSADMETGVHHFQSLLKQAFHRHLAAR
ncbi:MAG: aromatic ring-hydroxylating dioxygenase subunit alpha [Candidatus Palauibacterales bacterium]|nr:aromatic ring-hydroxylating dioxygenase subunit alpha [Candidatus Palauibacterales bacterium]